MWRENLIFREYRDYNSSNLENAFPHKNNSQKSNAEDFLYLVIQKILILIVLNILLYHFFLGSSIQQLGYITSVVLLKLHGCVVSHMQVLATTLLSVHNIKYSFSWTLTAYKTMFSTSPTYMYC